MNELIGDDSGVSQFTTNALENAPSGGASIGSDVWSHPDRTLTQANPTNQQLGTNQRLDLFGGFNLAFSQTLGTLGTWVAIYFTIKKDPTNDTDAEAIAQIKLSNPADGSDGLQILNQSDPLPSGITAADGAIVVDDSATGEVSISLKGAATVLIDPQEQQHYYWDVKKVVAANDAPSIGNRGVLTVTRASTRTTD